MTSLDLLPDIEHKVEVPKEWGTGDYKDDAKAKVFLPKSASFQYSQIPIEQHYKLTDLKLSNVRSNDQLLPKPQECDMGHILINKSFPAEHPYASHTSRSAVFPKFDSPEDPKRGVAARKEQPINPEMPANAYNVTVLKKTKGAGLRHEIQERPPESQKTALEWVGEDGFPQLVKAHGGRQQVYPSPPKSLVPNLQMRSPEMAVSDRTANTLRNIERSQWQTTHDLNFTGLGPSNPLKLDNLDEKRQYHAVTGLENDQLTACSMNTFDPPRPFEGRIARQLIPRPKPQITSEESQEDSDYKRMMTLTEKEEQRLLHGKEYTSLPEKDPRTPDERWRELNDRAHPEPHLEALSKSKSYTSSDSQPYQSAGSPENKSIDYLRRSKTDLDESIQDMEARNRWRLLESQTPAHDITELNVKYSHLTEGEKPQTFYKHEGGYNEERAGLYKTTYDPLKLEYSMNNRERSASEIMKTSQSHVDALYIPTLLSHDNRSALKNSRTVCHSAPNQSGDSMEAREVMNTYRRLKDDQKKILQPEPTTAGVVVQEGGLISKESTMGDSYNTKKFLQENGLHKYARNEPLNLISSENQTLSNVRQASGKSGKSVQFSDSVTVATSNDAGVVKLEKLPTRGVTPIERSYDLKIKETTRPPGDKINTTQYSSVHAMYSKANEDGNMKRPILTSRVSEPSVVKITPETTKDSIRDTKREWVRRPTTSEPTEYRDEFGSLATNIVPKTRNSWACGSSYASQFPTYMIDYKNDPRFSWEPGCDVPRPQTSLLRMQDRFSKTEVRRSFHNTFSEVGPDLRANITSGKTHHFWGLNAQLLHG